ncbi:MAG TPA: IS256 family transposase [Actinomycetes bacterium]|nr:IS256 family transposase [Actinomycetes bacterium]
MSKQYQTRDAGASTTELTIPEEVSVALAGIAESATEGLLALSVGAGLQVMQTLMEQSVTALAGPKAKHNPDRAAVRHGHEQGSVVLGGRRIPVQRPRVRATDGSGELPVAAYQLFSQTEVLGRLALERMLGGLSTRRYPLGLEPVGTQVEQAATGTSKSAISRRFVAMTHTALAELLSRDLSTLDLVCLLVDGVHFAEHCCVVALGIDMDGTKHPLALVEGSTENATLARELLVGLRERGLNVTRPILWVIDGAKALRRALLDVFDHPVIARCQQHKIRNVRDRLPQRLGGPVERRMRTAYHAASAPDAEAQLQALARELDKTHPGAAASLREGMAETLTVLRLGVPPTLARTLHSTNPIESMIEICREHAGNVKRWQDGQMALRWCAAGMVEAGKQFRRVNGYLHLPALRAALEAEVAGAVPPTCEGQEVEAA